MKKKKKNKSFTLIELIISSAIIAVVGVAVYSVFSGGLRVWQRAEGFRNYQRSPRLVLERAARELRNSLFFSQINFEGDKNSISFAGLIEDSSLEKVIYQVGRVTYYLDSEGVFCRKQKNYAQAFTIQNEDYLEDRELIWGVDELNFSYLGFNQDLGEYVWFDSWPYFLENDNEEKAEQGQPAKKEQALEELGLPVAVRIELIMKGKDTLESAYNQNLTKTVMLPLGLEVDRVRE